MAWNDLASNQMVSFTDAQGGGFTLNAGQVGVTSSQCMDKTAALAKYDLNSANMSAYASNQLVPKSDWVSAAPPIYINTGSGAEASFRSVNVPYPSGTILNGDFIMLHVISNSTISIPSGFTQLETDTTINSKVYGVYYRFANGSEGGTSVSVFSALANQIFGVIIQYRNVNIATPLYQYAPINYTTNISTMVGNSVNMVPIASNTLGVIVWLFPKGPSSISSTSVGTWTYNGGPSGAVTLNTIVSANRLFATAGSTGGTATINLTSAANGGRVLNILLRKA